MHRYAIWIIVVLALQGMVAGAHAQWPLGREVPQMGLKAEDSAIHVTATGKFQIFVSPQAKGYTFMLDTDTGRVWILKKDHASGDFFLQRIRVEQVDAEQTPKGGTSKPQPAEPGATKGK